MSKCRRQIYKANIFYEGSL